MKPVLPESIKGNFEDKHIVSVEQFTASDVEMVMNEATAMADLVYEKSKSDLLDGLVVANLFFEPSTRTYLSFEAAIKRLGADTISTQGVDFSSISKGESLPDTIETAGQYADTIVLRHGEVGAAAIAASISDVPVINGGDGVGEHPTQALLDWYTIQDEFEDTDNLTITMIGDLKHGRTVHSLAQLVAQQGASINYVSPLQLAMPVDLYQELGQKVQQYETENLDDVIADTDVLYVTRIQKERIIDPEDYELNKEAFVIDNKVMDRLNKDAIVMHPLPRVNEIHHEVDSDDRAVYFRQVKNGMFVRMALLAMVNGRSIRD